MFNFLCEVPEVSSQNTDKNSIWNSAGLPSTGFNPTLENLSSHFQNDPSSFTASPDTQAIEFDNALTQFSSFMQYGMTDSSKTPDQMDNDASSIISPDQSEGSGLTHQSPLVSSCKPPNSPVHTVSLPSPAVTKDPGYYSESECSSNSSEKESLSATFAKSLHLEPEATNDPVRAIPISNSNHVTPLPKASLTPTLDDNVLKSLVPRFDSQSFDPRDFNFAGDETWKVIKKPGKEVPEVSSPDSFQTFVSDGSWSGDSSPALSGRCSSSSLTGGKSSFAHFTKQQVCVFCRNNGEDESVYSTHTLMSTSGKVICPILYAYKCPICHATGDYAHTLKYCPMMPKGMNTPPNTNTRANPVVSALPKTATFPQHLSVNTRHNMPKSAHSTSAHSATKRLPKFAPQFQQIETPSGQPDSYGTITELQEAAQKILTFTNQVMSNQQPQSNACPPQIAQFLLKLDHKKNTGEPAVFSQSSDGNAMRFPTGLPNANLDQFGRPIISGSNPSSERFSNISAATGQGYQPFHATSHPSSANCPTDDINMKIKEFIDSLNSNPPEMSWTSEVFPGSKPPQKSFQPPQSFNAPPFLPRSQSRHRSTNDFGDVNNMAVNNPCINIADLNNAANTSTSINNIASAELFKILGINKTNGTASTRPSNNQANQESTLANILANLQEFERTKNGG